MQFKRSQRLIAVTALVVGGVGVYFGTVASRSPNAAPIVAPGKNVVPVASIQIAATAQNPTARVYYDKTAKVFGVAYFENDANGDSQKLQSYVGLKSVVDFFNNTPGMTAQARQTHLKIILTEAARISGVANLRELRGQPNGPSDLELLRTLLPGLQR